MQFSIFNVLFKCTKDMFVWEKVKWSILVYWAQLWRDVLLSISMLALAMTILIVPALINPDALQAFNNSSFELKLVMYIAYSINYWIKNWLVLGVGLLVLWGVSLILGAFYIQYFAVFKKSYRSFDRHFFKPQVEKFWSFGFWRPAILTMLIGFLIGVMTGFVLGWFNVLEIVISSIGLVVGLVLFHIFLHGGTWGFIPVSRQQSMLKNK